MLNIIPEYEQYHMQHDVTALVLPGDGPVPGLQFSLLTYAV